MNPQVRLALKKPIPIEFMVWPGGAENATAVIDWVLSQGGTARYVDQLEPVYIQIQTLEGVMHADPGYVIARGAKGEFYPIRPDVFRDTYDIIETPEETQQ